MKTNLISAPAMGLVTLLVGCASSNTTTSLWSTKQPLAHGALYRQAESVVMEADREKASDCDKRHIVKSELFKAPATMGDSHGAATVSFAGTSGTPENYYLPPDRRYSEFVEKWTVDRCGKEVDYLVTFTPRNSIEGGTTVKAELAQ